MPLPLDMPDDFLWLPGSGRSTVGDLGELAVRLGSPVSYDRRGSVFFLDDFSHGVSSWVLASSGAGATIVLSADNSIRGGYTAYMNAGSTSGQFAKMTRSINPAIQSGYGLEILFKLQSNVSFIQTVMSRYDGTEQHYSGVRLDIENQLLKYATAPDTFTTLQAINIDNGSAAAYHALKFVCDYDTDMYTRIMLDSDEYDLSSFPVYSAASAVRANTTFYVQVNSKTGLQAAIYLNHVIVTLGDY